jgi:hypothetical protein
VKITSFYGTHATNFLITGGYSIRMPDSLLPSQGLLFFGAVTEKCYQLVLQERLRLKRGCKKEFHVHICCSVGGWDPTLGLDV